MPLRALLLSQDAAVVRVLQPLLPELGIETEQCASPESSLQRVSREKFEAIIIDADSPGGFQFLASLRELPMTRHAIVFAIVRSVSTSDAFKAGANLVLEKPLSPEKAMRSFRAAHGMILRERRRYYRHPVNLSATFEYGSNLDGVTITNLSEGGMAIQSSKIFTPGLMMKWKFELPERKGALQGKGEVSWSDSSGHAGVRFVQVPIPYKEKLAIWLSERSIDEPVPLFLNVNRSWNRKS
jgi:CheY-like chemotaxis protein